MKNLRTFDEFLNETQIAANTLGSRLGGANKGSTVIIDEVTYTCLGKGKWENQEGEKFSWIEIGARAAAKGTEKIEYKR